jgi:serine phosphatase RsbU (regulator of sigma subunit)
MLKLHKVVLVLFKLAVYFGIYFVFRELVRFLSPGLADSIAFLLTMLLIITNRGKLTELIQKGVDKSFYHTLYRLKEAARSFNRELDFSIEYDVLLQQFVHFMDEAFKAGEYAIYVYKGGVFENINNHTAPPSTPKLIKYSLNHTRNSPFEAPIRFYSVEKVWRDFPRLRPLVKGHIKAKHFSYFLPLKGANNVVGFVMFHHSLRHYINMTEVSDYMLELFEKTADVLENANIHSAIKRKSLESELLLEIVKNISATLSLEGVLEGIVDNLSHLVSYDAATIILVDKDKKTMQEIVARGYDKQSRKTISLKLNQGVSGWVIRNKRGSISTDVSKDSNYYPARSHTKSQITVPIISRNTAIGALVLESDEAAHFKPTDLELLTIFSGLAAIAISNARLYEDSLKKRQLESELVVASKVQQALLPKRFPTIEGLSIEVLNIPSQIVGGDLYDTFRIDEHRQGIAIGDGSGKGTSGAILMAVAYAGFKSLFNEIRPVATVVALLNNLLTDVTTTAYYVTFCFGILDRLKNSFTYCNAGHNPPIVLRKDRSVEYLDEGGIVLGFMADQEYTQTCIPLNPGDYLCLYTDGVTELKNKNGEEFGEERLVSLLRENYGKDTKEIKFLVLEELKKFIGGAEFQDDVTLLIVCAE